MAEYHEPYGDSRLHQHEIERQVDVSLNRSWERRQAMTPRKGARVAFLYTLCIAFGGTIGVVLVRALT